MTTYVRQTKSRLWINNDRHQPVLYGFVGVNIYLLECDVINVTNT